MRGLAAGFDDLLPKPMDVTTLVAAIRAHARRSHAGEDALPA